MSNSFNDLRLQRLTQPGGPYELADGFAEGFPCRYYTRAPRRLIEIYHRSARMGNATLATWRGQTLSYRDAFQQSGQLAFTLHKWLGVGPGFRVGLALTNPLEWITAFIAVTSLDAIAVLCDQTDAKTVRHSMAVSDCELLITNEQFAQSCDPDIAPNIITFQALAAQNERKHTRGVPETVMRSDGTDVPPSQREAPELQTTIFAFTSGTSGRPKCVELTHRGIITGLMNMTLGAMISSIGARRAVATRDERAIAHRPCTLLLSPLSSVGGYGQILLTLLTGSKLTFLSQWSCNAASQLIDDQSVTSLSGATPTQLWELQEGNSDLSSLRSIWINGFAAHSRLLRDSVDRWPQVTVNTGYGLTETNGSIATIAGTALLERPLSCGRILPTVGIQIVGDDGGVLPNSQTGEIWLRGAYLMRGYREASRTPSGILNGWFRTGDLGQIDRDGDLLVVDRISDSMVIGGIQLSTLEVERAICDEHWVIEAAVLDLSVAHHHRVLLVAVVPKTGFEYHASSLRSRISVLGCIPEKLLSVVICERLPRNPSGKINRHALRASVTKS